MAPDRAARIATFVLVALAYAACEVAAHPDGRPRPFGVTFGFATLTMAVAVSYLVPPPGRRLPRLWQMLLLVGLLLPLAGEPLLRELTENGFPLELQLVNGLRTFGLLLCGLSAWPRCRRLSAVVALFLALFATAMGDQPAIPYLLSAFALAGGLWLVLNYRADGADGAEAVIGAEIERVALRLPYREGLVFAVLAVLAGSMAVAGPKRVLLNLGEFMPTSGGTGETDPFARYGIGDGPEEVAGDNARTAGMVETDRMIEDTRDALIDAVSETYGPPHKPRSQERMVSAGRAEVIENHERLKENRRPSRDFDTGRAGPKRDGSPPDGAAARGLFEVDGRTPLHVRQVVYDAYDAVDHTWREARKPYVLRLVPEGGDWMRLDNLRDVDWYAADDQHRLKATALRENLVPTPAVLTRFRIHKVDRPDYYEWDYEGVLALAGRKRTPPGVIVTADSRTVDPARLPASAFASTLSGSGEIPDPLRPLIDPLAAGWTSGLPRGWPQIAAIRDKLRAEFAYDPKATAPPDHPDPVAWFLTESRRGPDYLFATASAMLFRSAGYPSRVCLGYYAHPDGFDPETRHTPVRRTDLHFWPEIQLSDGQWLVVEPTPGFETLPPLKTWQERLADVARATLAWVGRNPLPVVAGLVVLWAAARLRRRIADGLYTLHWRVFPGRTWRESVLGAVWVLERRGRLAGIPREPSASLADWAYRLAAGRPDDGGLARLVRFAEWAAYAPHLPPPRPEPDIRTACRAALDRWPLSAFPTPGVPPACPL